MSDQKSTGTETLMSQAVQTAVGGQRRVSPNPRVGALIVRDGKIIGKGRHEHFGGPHAEMNAIRDAGAAAAGADMYVTLEPCCHSGKTPPCTDLIIRSGIKRVFVGMQDPNPLVSGREYGSCAGPASPCGTGSSGSSVQRSISPLSR
ncbi:MAG: bifunctional diaminohydroxyphosphoribosylaminopyrimidine deaminase/5-amino-6-(5-phosphoribosylamino)uracil reductase RibD [Candidatus Marinimicrobia bacterium]|nr:bifunctional diaminohydroxyphosphoribosylaminopyrimidine deaminase/5-amino-6-(5-phosphoribosylamino)uracil reductase RibD [Candidatus Neomarinimicrobiota bacterium]